MNLSQIFNFFNTTMIDSWTYTELEMDNVTSVDIINATEFVRFSIYVDSIVNVGHGSNPTKLLRGTVTCEIFIRQNQGAGRATELFDLYQPIFDNLKSGLIKCQATEVVNRGQVMPGTTLADRNWFMLNAITPFQVGFD